MKLFRRLLLSLLPEELVQHETSPAGMFLSFVNPKHFFSVICRKVVENYKLNLFDVWLDPFEVKIWFGEQPTLEVKDMNFYYSYAIVANLNGWSFYSPSNIWVALTLLVSVYTKDVFKKRHWSHFYNFLVTVNILCYVFVSRIKIFPYPVEEREKNYQRFVSVFFNFYKVTLNSGKQKIDDKEFEVLKKELLQHIHVFFLLYYVYIKLGELFTTSQLSQSEFYQRLFHDYLQKGKYVQDTQEFIQRASAYTKISQFSDLDERLIKLLLPTDMLIKYVFHHKHTYEVADTIFAEVFPTSKMDDIVMSFLKGDERLEELLQQLLDFRQYKKSYFPAMKKFITHTYRLNQDYAQSQEIDSFISSLESGQGFVEMNKVPDALRKESMMTERFVNFYITFLWWSRVGRWDNFSMRLFEKPILEKILTKVGTGELKQESLMFYGGMLYNYSKNAFYYKYAHTNIKEWNDQFSMPMRPTIKEVHSNMYILKLFDEHFVTTCFQDLNRKTLSINVANPGLIESYKDHLAEKISRLVQFEASEQFYAMYGDLLSFVPEIAGVIHEADFFWRISKGEALKENMYTLDLWLRQEAIQFLNAQEVWFSDHYSELVIMWIFASLRETFFGLLLYMTHITTQKDTTDIADHIQTLQVIYIQDILMIDKQYTSLFMLMIEYVRKRYDGLLQQRLTLDENQWYIDIWWTNRLDYATQKDQQTLVQGLRWEDIVRWRWFLKHLSYYNRRYVMPK